MGKWATANLHSKREGMQLLGKKRKYASYKTRLEAGDSLGQSSGSFTQNPSE